VTDHPDPRPDDAEVVPGGTPSGDRLAPRPDAEPTDAEPRVVEPTPGDAAAGEEAADVAPAPRRGFVRPSRRGLAGWLALAAVAALLDGWVGLLAPFVVAVVVGARLRRSVLGAIGTFFLALAGLGVLLDSSGDRSDVHQAFVTRSLVPHHLTFLGLALVCTWVVLDLAPHLTGGRAGEPGTPEPAPLAGRSARLRVVLVVVAWVACAATIVGVLRA